MRVAGGRIEPVADDWLLDPFDRTVHFVAVRDGQEHMKGRASMARQAHQRQERRTRSAGTVCRHHGPTIRDDGRLLDKPA